MPGWAMGASRPRARWLLGSLSVGTPCWAVQAPASGHPPLPQSLDFPPVSEAMGEGMTLEGKGEQSLGVGAASRGMPTPSSVWG